MPRHQILWDVVHSVLEIERVFGAEWFNDSFAFFCEVDVWLLIKRNVVSRIPECVRRSVFSWDLPQSLTVNPKENP